MTALLSLAAWVCGVVLVGAAVVVIAAAWTAVLRVATFYLLY